MSQQLGFRRSSLSWAEESSYGSLSATTGLPDVSGLSFTAAEVLAFNAYEGQDEPMIPRDIARAYPGAYPDEPLTVYSSGTPQQRRSGEMTIRFNGLRCPVAGSAVSTLFLARLLRTVCAYSARTASDEDTVAAGSFTTNAYDVATPGEFAVGRMVARTVNNLVEFSRVSDITSSTITSSPAWSTTPAQNDVIRHVETYSPTLGALNGVSNKSLALRYDIAGRRFNASGCRLTGLTIDVGENGIPTVTARVMLGWVQDDDGSASPANVGAQGVYAQRGQSYDVYASHATASTPLSLGRNTIAARKWSFSVDWTLTPEGRADNGMGHGDMIVSDVKATLTMSISPDGTLEALRRTSTAAQVVCGLGPTSAGNAGRQMGFAVCLNAGLVAEYARPNVGDRETTVELRLVDGVYAYDTGNWTANGSVDAPWCVGWVC